ncbi:MAG: hypothetical protein DRN20_05850 [Thermoplasmata archaeon]|nr:MAG: hypothetical protein DRN20_05850 [Thermoplasmata archaeon]
MAITKKFDAIIASMSETQIIILFLSLTILLASLGLGAYRATREEGSIKCLGCLGMVPEVPGFNNWWINYPEGHVKAGQSVPHPQWVRSALEEKKVVLIFLWEKGCTGCEEEWNDWQSYGLVSGSKNNPELLKYSEWVAFYSYDVHANDKGKNAVYTYDPEGKNFGVPLTVFIVRLSDGRIGWWSCKGPISGSDADKILDIAVHS